MQFRLNNNFRFRYKMSEGRELSNAWRIPQDIYGPHDSSIREKIEQTYFHQVSAQDWTDQFSLVDYVLNVVVSGMKEQARRHFKGLQIDERFVRQASTRQGLKLSIAGDFDILVPIQFEGLELQQVQLRDAESNQLFTGFMRLRVLNDRNLEEIVPELKRHDVFRLVQGTCLIDTMNLQRRVFQSILDKAVDATKDRLMRERGCAITRGVRPPTLNISIRFQHQSQPVEVDIVPGLFLGSETIDIPSDVTINHNLSRVKLLRYGLMKWVNKENAHIREADRIFIWRNCSSAYERCMFDLCLDQTERQYIVTACRIMKVVVKSLRERQNHAANLLNSYHLKTIAMYCILLLTVPSVIRSADTTVVGVREALGYFIRFTEIALEMKKLPDFFLGNDFLQKIFPGSYFANVQIQQNLFDKENPRHVESARYGLPEIKAALSGCFSVELNDRVVQCFRNRILK